MNHPFSWRGACRAAAARVSFSDPTANRTPARRVLLAFAVLMMPPAVSAAAPERTVDREVSGPRLEQLRLRQPVVVNGVDRAQFSSRVHPSLRGSRGRQQVLVRLRGASVGRIADQDPSTQMSRKLQLQVEQAEFIQRGQSRINMRVEAQTQMVLNAVFADVDAADLETLASDPSVERIVPVANYRMHLAETVPYIGAAAVQASGFDGSGVRVAVLDSGVDYTHAALGGPGTLEGYAAAYDDPVARDGLFPTAKVVEGVDLVGETWDGDTVTDLSPDDDPIDFDGHGTHVADIIGGLAGVAPGVELYAVKVCSAVTTSCSGIALIQGMEYAVDPNGDGNSADAVDIINMSLGSDYGQPFDDDLSQAVDASLRLGVLTVASAGNGGDKPYIAGTPASAVAALSVAQTQVPSASLQLISVGGGDYPAVFQPWSAELTETISGPLQYGDGAGGNLDGCAEFAAGSLDGLIVLVDRGNCNFTLKVLNVELAGGVAGIIGLIDPGAPFSGGDGGDGPIGIPGYMISQEDSLAMQAAVGTEATIDPANQLPLVGQMVGSSSRGPQHESTTLIKPEIGAPGASVSAIAGTGSETGPFGGTSGAAPMVSGAAALVMDADPDKTPIEVKAALATHGETAINTDPFTGLAPITRIGGGELRVDAAVQSNIVAWDATTRQPALSFGFREVFRDLVTVRKRIVVRNYSDKPVKLDITPTFRYPEDAATGAVTVQVQKHLNLRPNSDSVLSVLVRIRGDALLDNAMSSGPEGANPESLTLNEFDGYLQFSGSGENLQLPWHVLPRKAAHVTGRRMLNFRDGFDTLALLNRGVGTAQIDGFALLALSPNIPEGGAGQQSPTPDIRGVGVNTFPVPAGFCSDEASFVWAFAINTWERQQHLLPVVHQVVLDIDQDGIDDYVILNQDFSGFGTISDGRQLAYALDLATGNASAFFFAEHATNTGNTVMFVCGEQVGLTGTDMLTTMVDVEVYTDDFYYGGPGDAVTGLTVTPLGEQHFAYTEDIPAHGSANIPVQDFGWFPGTTQELGLMLISNGDRGAGLRGGASEQTEAKFLLNKDVAN